MRSSDEQRRRPSPTCESARRSWPRPRRVLLDDYLAAPIASAASRHLAQALCEGLGRQCRRIPPDAVHEHRAVDAEWQRRRGRTGAAAAPEASRSSQHASLHHPAHGRLPYPPCSCMIAFTVLHHAHCARRAV
ncbi:MAG: hypothetical protein MZV70_45655 [Desulfobacterales bacterium]|nr:hypothetical protein [Desulfobacterales bacterium]